MFNIFTFLLIDKLTYDTIKAYAFLSIYKLNLVVLVCARVCTCT